MQNLAEQISQPYEKSPTTHADGLFKKRAQAPPLGGA